MKMVLVAGTTATMRSQPDTTANVVATVKKGEKGIVIIAPMSIRPKDDESEGKKKSERARPVLRFRGVFVFDGSMLPTGVGVNPQETIMAMSSVLTTRLLSRWP